VFVPGKAFQSRLMIVNAGAYPTKASLDDTLQGRLLALPTIVRLGWKGFPGTNISSLEVYVNTDVKSFVILRRNKQVRWRNHLQCLLIF